MELIMFEQLPALPQDPILGLSVAYRADTNPLKVDLGIGVYKDESGNTPVLKAVTSAQQQYLSKETSKAYMAPAGPAVANEALQTLIFGADRDSTRIRTIQTPGGTGALRVAAELVSRAAPGAAVWLSNPSWANHTPLMNDAGLQVKEYPYYDAQAHQVDFEAMMSTLAEAKKGDLVLLHACCHNPCGADLSHEQWQTVADLAVKNEFTPFIDMAYQGFGSSLDDDAYGARLMASSVPEVLVASSCSKNFGLYRERAGTLSIVSSSAERADIAESQLLSVTRGIYSMPPSNGALIVETILTSPELTEMWHNELDEMRGRIKGLRTLLAKKLAEKTSIKRDFSFIEQERGMFSFLGLSTEQVQTLKNDYSIYMVNSSRINIAGISQDNVDYLANAIEAVL